jgi:L-fucose isomerase-like protein
MAASRGKSTFALYIGNRGFFPASFLSSARAEMTKVLTDQGHKVLAMDPGATRHGAVETVAEGNAYAKWLKEQDGNYDGVVITLPNFGDENGAAVALRDAGVPILIQAYPDEMSKMAPAQRRDAFCGKLSIMDVFRQNGIKFSALKPHTVSPASEDFAENVDHFDRVCRVVNGLKRMTVGAIGARTTAFKTVRFDELALQKHGITVEAFDLLSVFAEMQKIDAAAAEYKAKAESLNNYTDFSKTPTEGFGKLVKLGVVLDQMIAEYALDTIAVRCWMEMQQVIGVSPCVLLSELNNRMQTAACEVDVGNAVAMYAASLASADAAACLDWNNNYGDDENKCILFHCGPVPQSMMTKRGTVTDHKILQNVVPMECTFGCNVGRISQTPFTFASMATDSGKLKWYVGEGEFTDDPIPDDFFGCAGVADIPNLQDVLLHIGYEGHRHHVSVTPGMVADSMIEAMNTYLGYEVSVPQCD